MSEAESSLIKWISVDAEELKKLYAFKEYVHKRLDDAGVPKEVPGQHLAEGCRIGGRLDIVLAKFSQ